LRIAATDGRGHTSGKGEAHHERSVVFQLVPGGPAAGRVGKRGENHVQNPSTAQAQTPGGRAGHTKRRAAGGLSSSKGALLSVSGKLQGRGATARLGGASERGRPHPSETRTPVEGWPHGPFCRRQFQGDCGATRRGRGFGDEPAASFQAPHRHRSAPCMPHDLRIDEPAVLPRTARNRGWRLQGLEPACWPKAQQRSNTGDLVFSLSGR